MSLLKCFGLLRLAEVKSQFETEN
uniref:Uncharacterized protein n=1 Tax=Anguilla anguilla TaxID=7936 RepID=A0A0E9QRQ4_ANGAN